MPSVGFINRDFHGKMGGFGCLACWSIQEILLWLVSDFSDLETSALALNNTFLSETPEVRSLNPTRLVFKAAGLPTVVCRSFPLPVPREKLREKTTFKALFKLWLPSCAALGTLQSMLLDRKWIPWSWTMWWFQLNPSYKIHTLPLVFTYRSA